MALKDPYLLIGILYSSQNRFVPGYPCRENKNENVRLNNSTEQTFFNVLFFHVTFSQFLHYGDGTSEHPKGKNIYVQTFPAERTWVNLKFSASSLICVRRRTGVRYKGILIKISNSPEFLSSSEFTLLPLLLDTLYLPAKAAVPMNLAQTWTQTPQNRSILWSEAYKQEKIINKS